MLSRFVARTLPLLPRSVVGAVARRYIAGEDLAAARGTVDELAEAGMHATVDILGEDVTSEDEADQVLGEYRAAVREIATWRHRERVGLSLKPTQFGLRAAPEVAAARLRELLGEAREAGLFVRLDMEDSSTTDAIFTLYDELAQEAPSSVGCVLQAMLFRTRLDAARLAEEETARGGQGPHRHDVRLCKGIYQEPSDRAWQEFEGVRDNYVHVARTLLAGGVRLRAATHDRYLIDAVEALGRELDIPPSDIEFQALLGVPIQKTLARLRDRGHPVRLYVPFGRAWYAYSVRRLRENPAVVGHVVRAMFRRQR